MTSSARYGVLVAFAVAACGPVPHSIPEPGPPPPQPAVELGTHLALAFSAHDAKAVAAVFAPDGVVAVIGDPGVHRGRAAIEHAAGAIFGWFQDARLTIGRVWIGGDASVLELVFSDTTSARQVGVVGAAVVTLDPDGLAVNMRVYLDVPTIIAQLDLALLPAGVGTRPITSSVPAGSQIFVHQGIAAEASNLTRTNRIWDALSAHDAADVMAPTAVDYRYEDFAAPGPLTRDGTQQMVERFLATVPDFAISARPVEFAVGDEVVTEMIETGTVKGKPITLHGLDVKQFAAGRVVAEWQYSNYAEVLTQILATRLPALGP